MRLSNLFVGGAFASVVGIVVLMIARPDENAMTALTLITIGFGIGSLAARFIED